MTNLLYGDTNVSSMWSEEGEGKERQIWDDVEGHASTKVILGMLLYTYNVIIEFIFVYITYLLSSTVRKSDYFSLQL